MTTQDIYDRKIVTRATERSAKVVKNLSGGGGAVDLTAPSTPIGSVTPVAVTSTIFTASPANNTSAYVASGSSLTGSNAQSLVNLSQIWDTTGTPTLFKANVTDTASNAASLLMDLKTGGVTRASISKVGTLTLNGTSSVGAAIISTAEFRAGSILIGFNNASGSGGAAFGNSILSTFGGCNSAGFYTALSYGIGSATAAAPDVILSRDAANTLAQRNSTTTQVSRLYKSFTDASNYTRLAKQFDANGVQLAAESAGTGDANIDITFSPKGTGNVRFGTHAAVGAEVVTGYITIKDSSGTLRKLAVVS
jgi:hypothetical protein